MLYHHSQWIRPIHSLVFFIGATRATGQSIAPVPVPVESMEKISRYQNTINMMLSSKWNNFPHYRPFVRGIHRSPVNSPHKGQWRGALMFSLICVWINGWVNNGEAGDLRRYRAHYAVTVMNSDHYIDVIMTTMASQITSLTVVCSIVYLGADQRKHQSSASLAFVWGIHRDRFTVSPLPSSRVSLTGTLINHTEQCKQYVLE